MGRLLAAFIWFGVICAAIVAVFLSAPIWLLDEARARRDSFEN